MRKFLHYLLGAALATGLGFGIVTYVFVCMEVSR
jgi:hypothetical protein